MLRLALALPYAARVRTMGWLCARVVAPLAGWRKRIRANLALARPDLDTAEVERLVRRVPDNVGRTLIEIYSGAEFKDHVRGTPLSGPGLEPLQAARAAGRPVVLVTAHLGNFDALRATLITEGYDLGALYRPMRNKAFNTHYVGALASIGEPLFPSNRKGVTGFVRHLADGGIIGILTDVYSSKGADVTFFGQSAPTAISACDWAVKYDALVVPCYGIRRPGGLDFDIRLEEPIPLGDPVEMTQAINDNLETLVRAHMDQWFWIHRRWKPWRKRKGAPRPA
ncbi:lysophospholipid acyltransferase family protein [Palleronia sp. LCG004]|uniref:lysophospholipid acyltransferase family protein n=1 Tax=Palleronia sp. LCG004 TaxID=3079304 RepID=UPI00397D1FE8